MKYILYLLAVLLIGVSSCKKKSAPAPTLVYQDNLTTNNQTWTVDSDGVSSRGFEQGHYFIRLVDTGLISFSDAPYASINFPYTVQVDASPVLDNITRQGCVALAFNRDSSDDYNVVEVWANGTYRIWTRLNNNVTTQVNFTASGAISTGSGSKNTIKIIQNQSDMELVINNTSIGTFYISLPPVLLHTGPAVATSTNSFTPVTGWFNNYSIWKN